MSKLNVVFMGTPEFAVNILESLVGVYNVSLVVTQPDKFVGRKKELKFSEVKECAIKHGIDVFQPVKIREDYQVIIDKNPDIIITCAYGQIIPEELINLPRLGCINVHASLLPKLRGGAPIHKCIIDGETETGITIMYMDKTMDTGDIISQSVLRIENNDNVGILHEKLSVMGANLLMETMPSIIDGTNDRVKQDNELATYAYNISREDEHLDFNKTSLEVYNKVRGLNPWPSANLILNEEEIKIIEVEIVDYKSHLSSGTVVCASKSELIIKTTNGAVSVKKLKPSGKRIMEVREYLNGANRNEIINKIVK